MEKLKQIEPSQIEPSQQSQIDDLNLPKEPTSQPALQPLLQTTPQPPLQPIPQPVLQPPKKRIKKTKKKSRNKRSRRRKAKMRKRREYYELNAKSNVDFKEDLVTKNFSIASGYGHEVVSIISESPINKTKSTSPCTCKKGKCKGMYFIIYCNNFFFFFFLFFFFFFFFLKL